MKKILSSFLLLLLFGCGSYLPEQRTVYKHSEYLNKTYTSKVPLVYRNNLPRVEDVPKYVALNTDTLLSKKADRSLVQFRYNCTGCLDSETLVTPIRIQYIPVGTNFTVVDEYLYYSTYGIETTEIHYLIVEDEFGNVSEISELSFKLEVINGQKIWDEELKILESITLFENQTPVSFCFCPSPYVKNVPNPIGFIKDFQLTSEVVIEKDRSCGHCYKLTFQTLESYMTAQYYFTEWSLHGKWKALELQK